MPKKILTTHIPFHPKIRLAGHEVDTELLEEIKKMAKFYKKPIQDFTARFELFPDPRGWQRYGHFLVAEVNYKGHLTLSN